MANISQIQVGSNTYDICDATARDFMSNFKTVRLNNANSFTINADKNSFYDFSLNNTDIDSSWIIIGVMAIRNKHDIVGIISNVEVVDNRIIRVHIRNFKAADLIYAANDLEVCLLIGKIDFCPQLSLTQPSIRA